jgi:N-acylneuraminate cytidylyltransferase
MLVPLLTDRITARSQDLPELFCPTGAVWWARAPVLLRERTFHVPGRSGWELPWQRAVDIDTEDDWQLAELLLRRAQAPEVIGVR